MFVDMICMILLSVFVVDSDFLQGVKKVFGSDEKKEFVDPYFLAGFAGTKVYVCFFSSITLQSVRVENEKLL